MKRGAIPIRSERVGQDVGRLDGRPARGGFRIGAGRPAEPLSRRLARFSIPCPATGCLLWTAELNRKGYGRIKIETADGVKNRKVHRVAYEIGVGPIPPGHKVRHRCLVRCCIEPGHLYTTERAGTYA